MDEFIMKEIVAYIKEIYKHEDFIPLHRPLLNGNEKKYIEQCIDSTFVSSVGAFVDLFEEKFAEYIGAKHAIVTANGTQALHLAFRLYNIGKGDEVITQPLTFIATANAITYTGAVPVFVDVDRKTLGMSASKLYEFLSENTTQQDGICINKHTGRKVKAIVPMHTFGQPVEADKLKEVCRAYNVLLIEDAAESLGSFYKKKHTGTYGELGVFSFNGNKIMTTGGGGMLVTDNGELAKMAKHLSTQAKLPHKWEYDHDQTGYNYRMPNINAALGLAQLEKMPEFLKDKRALAELYAVFFNTKGINYFTEIDSASSNYWLNTLILKDRNERDCFLDYTNANGVMTRPAWKLMNKLNMYTGCQCGDLTNAEYLEDRLVNIPSSVRIK